MGETVQESRTLARDAGLCSNPSTTESIIAKNQNTFAKRQREAEKKRKAEEKKVRRVTRKEQGGLAYVPDVELDDQDPSDEQSPPADPIAK